MLFKKHFIRIKIAITLASSIFVTWAIFNKPVIKGVEPVGILPNWTVPGDEFFIYLIHYAFFTFTSFGLLIWQRKKTNPITKKRIDLILIGGFIAWLGGWTAFLPGWGVKIEPYGMFLISFFQLMIGYSILKYQAFDIKLTLTKFTSIVVTSLISFSTATIAVYSIFRASSLQINSNSLIFAVSILSLGFIFGKFFDNAVLKLQTTLQKKFLKGHYNTEEIISNLSNVLIYQHDYDSVMKTIAMEFVNQLELSGSYILIRDTSLEKFEIKDTFSNDVINTISNTHPFIEYCQNKPEPFHLSELPALVKNSIKEYGFDETSVAFAIHSLKKVQGIFILNQKLTEKPFTTSDFKLLSTVTNQIIVVFERIAKEKELAEANKALKNLNDSLEDKVAEQVKEINEKHKLEKELQLASQIQERVLPSKVPKIAQYSLSANFYPARTVSGDYYDFLVFSEHKIGILIADIVGKGIPASFHMMNLKNLVHQTIREFHSPSEALSELNEEIIRDRVIDKYVPVTYGILNTKDNTFTYSNAGHEPAFYVSKKDVKELNTGGMPLGMDENEEYEQETIKLKDNDTILLFTDGLFDARNTEDEEFGPNRVIKTLKEHTQNVQDELSLQAKLIQTWKDFQDNEKQQKDDMTLITIEHEKLTFTKPKQKPKTN